MTMRENSNTERRIRGSRVLCIWVMSIHQHKLYL